MTVFSSKISPCAPAKGTCACPECGGLECLCRPRFFAGQLLTEEVLNQLDHYIRARFRMHNLSLHGTGVVNGLAVLCDPCGEVLVSAGHAISPCGDDIIVCDDVAVPICELIRKCRKCERGPNDCDPPRRMPNSNCDDLEEEWVLAIKYDERPTRGVLPLRTGTCSSCGCGSHTCDCHDCGCDACCQPPAKQQPKPRTAPNECEPSVICEGFRFCVYRKPEDDERGDNDDIGLFDPDSPLVTRIRCCFEALIAALPTAPQISDNAIGTLAGRRALTNYCCRLRQNLLDYFTKYPNTNCEIIQVLKRLECPDPENADQFAADFVNSFLILLGVVLDAIKQCLCLGLLPPAPEPTCDDRVSLATVKVRAGDCQVISVCNWTTHRDILISWPAIGYWLGSLSFWDLVRDLLDRICCNSLVDIFEDILDDPIAGAAAESGTVPVNDDIAGPADLQVGQRFNTAFARAYPRFTASVDVSNLRAFNADFSRRGDQRLDFAAVLNATSRRFALPETGAPLGPLERANLPETLIAEFLAKPIFQALSTENDPDGPTQGNPDEPGGVRETMADMADLRRELEQQRAEIDDLKAALAERG